MCCTAAALGRCGVLYKVALGGVGLWTLPRLGKGSLFEKKNLHR